MPVVNALAVPSGTRASEALRPWAVQQLRRFRRFTHLSASAVKVKSIAVPFAGIWRCYVVSKSFAFFLKVDFLESCPAGLYLHGFLGIRCANGYFVTGLSFLCLSSEELNPSCYLKCLLQNR